MPWINSLARVQLTDSDQHTSMLKYNVNYGCKKFYDAVCKFGTSLGCCVGYGAITLSITTLSIMTNSIITFCITVNKFATLSITTLSTMTDCCYV